MFKKIMVVSEKIIYVDIMPFNAFQINVQSDINFSNRTILRSGKSLVDLVPFYDIEIEVGRRRRWKSLTTLEGK